MMTIMSRSLTSVLPAAYDFRKSSVVFAFFAILLHSEAVMKLGCPPRSWGGDCSEACPEHCANATCQQDTGQCTEGCLRGYTGTDCTAECTTGYHGNGCLVPCNEHCKSGTCDAHTGACDQGCLDGYWGSDCSLGVDFKRNSPLGKREFYENLSAQGKSVLLYLLTSRYDHALARAQFEIEQAVRDRNEIQFLLQG